MANFNYPASPKADVKELTQVSSGYRKNVSRVLLSIFIFITGYLAVLVLSVFLIYFGAKLALGVLMLKAHWLTLLAAAGIMVVVIMFFVFVIKFMFKIKKDAGDNRVEITREEQPLLFEFIERVCNETKAPMPKKIVVSPAVNACVYYDSSFISMFFPAGKNLEIGLGLVSSVNITEFKAVVAHEFGHFSQSSTKLGSYVYRFNRMIHNLLYDNDSWTSTLNSVTSIHAVLGFFGRITVGMADLVLRFFMQLYKLVNVSYLSLSREMEFHADAVAISVSGSRPIISALYRLEFANEAYNYTLNGIAGYKKDDVRHPENFFTLLEQNMLALARLNNLPLENNLPVIDENFIKTEMPESRIHFKDVWASHPSTPDREKNANRIILNSEIIKDSPWKLFSNPAELQKKLSKHLTELEVKTRDIFTTAELQSHFEKIEKDSYFNPIYKSFYTYANTTFAIPNDENKKDVLSLDIADIFNDRLLMKLKRHNKNIYDTEIIKNISEGHLDVKKFDFDGKSYTRYYSAEVYQRLRNETEDGSKEIKNHIQKIADWFYFKSEAIGSPLATKYKILMAFRHKMAKDREPLTALYEGLIAFYQKELTYDRTMDDLPDLKKKLGKFYQDYKNAHANIEEGIVPTELFSEVISEKGYTATLFSKTIEDPSSNRNLEGFGPFVNALRELIEKFGEVDLKVYQMVIKIQDQILEQMA